MPPTQLKRLQDAYRKAAELVLMDPVDLPIFERLEKEMLAAEAAGDAVARARAVPSVRKLRWRDPDPITAKLRMCRAKCKVYCTVKLGGGAWAASS